MLDSALYAIIQLLRFALPSLLTLVLLAMEGLFLGFMAWYYIMPMVTLPSVFFWALYRPALMPLFVAVIIGLAEGAVFNSPLGLAVVPLVITVALVQVARRRLAGGKKREPGRLGRDEGGNIGKILLRRLGACRLGGAFRRRVAGGFRLRP